MATRTEKTLTVAAALIAVGVVVVATSQMSSSGRWVVGEAIAPGTYMLPVPATGTCEISILGSGDDGTSVLDAYEAGAGDQPKVILKMGQVFTSDCGEWARLSD